VKEVGILTVKQLTRQIEMIVDESLPEGEDFTIKFVNVKKGG